MPRTFDTERELHRHGTALRALALALLGDRDAADDVVQETWLRAVERPPRHGASPGGWLATVLRHFASRRRRGQQRRVRREQAAARGEAVEDVAAVVAREEMLQRVVDAVKGLEQPYRDAIWQRWFEELTPAAMATKGGVPVATVKSRLQRGLALLRDRLERDGEAGEWRTALATAFGIGRGVGVGVAAATGVVLMGTGTKVVVGAASVLLVAAMLWWWGKQPEPLPTPLAHASTPTPARADLQQPDAPVAPAANEREEVAAPPPSPATAPAAATWRLRGRIVAAETGAPIAATAQLNRYDGLTLDACTSEADGSFELTSSGAERLLVNISAGGRVSQACMAGPLGAGQCEELGTITLRRGFAVSGVIVDESGQPVAAQKLLIWAASSTASRLQETATVTAESDARGVFATTNLLAPGEWKLKPEGRQLLSAAFFTIVADTGAEPLTVVTAPWPRIAGVFVDDLGAPVPGVRLRVEQPAAWTVSRPDGSFELRPTDAAASGVTRLVIDDPGRCERLMPIDNVAWGTVDLRIVMQRVPPLTLQVVTQDGKPVERFGVICRRDTSLDTIRFRGEHRDGRLEIEGVCSGRHWLRVLPTDPDLEPSPAQAIDGPGGQLRIVLERRRFCRAVVVAGEAPVAGAEVELLRTEGTYSIDSLVVDPQKGDVASMPGLPRHELTARVMTDAAGIAVLPVASARQHLVLSVRAAGHPKQWFRDPALSPDGAPLRLELIACGSIAGRIELRGQERQRYQVVCEPLQVGTEVAVQRSLPQPDGAFATELLPAGRYRVSVAMLLPIKQAFSSQKFAAMPRLERDVEVPTEAATALVFDIGDVALATMHGRIRVDGAATVRVELVRQQDGEENIRFGPFATDADGRFTAEGLLPGDYRLALGIGDGAAEILPAVLADTFALQPGEDATREFAAQRRRLVVHLQHRDGTPVKNEIVRVSGGGCAWPRSLMMSPRVTEQLVFDPAPVVPLRFCLFTGEVARPWHELSEPVAMPQDRTEAEVTVVLPPQ